MSVLTHPRLPHLRTAAPGTHVPRQRGSDELRPWSPQPPTPGDSQDRDHRIALSLAGLAVVATAVGGLLVAAPWDDDTPTVQAPAGTVSVSTTDQARDDALSGRGPAGAASLGGGGAAGAGTGIVDDTDGLRDETLSRRGTG